jgi:hypothetical protein
MDKIESAKQKLKEKLKKDKIKSDLILEKGKTVILKAEQSNYDRGLRVELLKDGGYKVQYWYDNPNKSYPIEVLLDGKSIKKDVKDITMKFHPELK